MKDSATYQQISSIIANTLGVEDVAEISPESEFIADLNAAIDEIALIIKKAEEAFEVELHVENPEDIITVSHLVDLVEEALI